MYVDGDSPTGLKWKPRLCNGKDIGGKNVGGQIKKKNKYWHIETHGERYPAHRVVWALANGGIGVLDLIDHIDGNGLNNRIENLQLVSNIENTNFRSVTNGNKLFGYEKIKRPSGVVWRCRFKFFGARVSIGIFPTEEEAAAARDNWFRACGINPRKWNFGS